MKRFPTKRGVILFGAVIGAIFLSKSIMKNGLISFPKPLVGFESYLFTKVENFGGFIGKIENFNRLASENDKLKQEQSEILSFKAKIDDLESENEFLRRAAGITQKLDYSIIYAGIFNLNFAPTGYNVLLNKGIQDGISEGDVVVTDDGILVGKIQKVMQNFSRVLFVSDQEFKITAKVMNSGTTGIARGALIEGMFLDFVVQEDEIKERDVLISTGNDLFPAGLVVGSIDHIEDNATQMFKKVHIRPAVKDIQLGRVLVIKMK